MEFRIIPRIVLRVIVFFNVLVFTSMKAKDVSFNYENVVTSPTDSTSTKQQKAPSNELLKYYKNKLVPKATKSNTLVTKKYKSFASLEKENTTRFQYSFENQEPEFTQAFIVENFPKSPVIDSVKQKAKKLFDQIKDLKKYVDVLKGDHFFDLPVGLSKKDETGNAIEIVVSEAKMFPKYAELKLFAKLDIPQRGIQLFFGAEGVKFSHKGAFIGETKLVLLGNQPIPFNANNWLITLKGSSNLKTNTFGENSFVSIDCTGLKEISLEADVLVSRSVLIPLDNQGNYQCGAPKPVDKGDEILENNKRLDDKCYLGSSFSVKAKGWNDLLVEIDLPPFEINGLKGWAFKLSNTVLDLSDTRNSELVEFPKIYDNLLVSGQEELWRGIYAKEVKVSLPKAIESSGERVAFSAKDLLLDSNGVTGKFGGSNVLNLNEGAAGKWPFSIDSLSIELGLNKLRGGSLAGELKVPIVEKPYGYEGWVSGKDFGLKVIAKESVDVPIFLAKMELYENSSVGIDVIDDNMYPNANLSGKMTIIANIGQQKSSETLATENNKQGEEEQLTSTQEKSDLLFPEIRFEELELNTRPGKPFIQVNKFSYEGSNNDLFNFPITVDNLKLLTPSKDKVGLGFDMTINLDKNGSYAKGKLGILGKIEEGKRIQNWKFHKVALDGVKIDINRSGAKVKGELIAIKNDPTYGNGFTGTLDVEIEKLKLKAKAKGMFGKKDFRYWFVDAWSDNADGGDSKLKIKKWVGGLSYAMQKNKGSDPFTPSGAVYVPNRNYGLGFRAGVEIATKSKAFKGKAFLEMEFNRNGGLNRLGFMGDGALMLKKGGTDTSSDKGDLIDIDAKIASFIDKAKGKLGKSKIKLLSKNADKIGEAIDKGLEKGTPIAENAIDEQLSGGNYLSVSQGAIPKGEIAKSGSVGVYVGIEKDFTTDTFHGEFEVYVDLKTVKGASIPNSTLAGRAVIHTSPSKWYLHVGTPNTPIRLAFILAPERFEIGGYFMTGNVMPTQLRPHHRVIQILGEDIMDNNRSDTELTAGRGFAFGLSFTYAKDFRWSAFYAFIEAGVGFDVMYRHYEGVTCKGRAGPIGDNGWYSLGQVYAYLYGEFGVRVKLFGKRRSYKILEAGVAALLRGKFPNPSYFEGYVGAYYSVLGGLVKGRMRLHVEIGEECIIERDAGDGLEIPIIAEIDPGDKVTKVDVFTSPQVSFNYTLNEVVTLEESDGTHRYVVELEEAKILAEGKEVPIELVWNDTKDVVTYKLNTDILPSEKQVTVRTKVTFKEYTNGSWSPVQRGGKDVYELKEVTFTTDKAPEYIPLQNIKYMYPYKDQEALLTEEYNKGYIQLKLNQSYLLHANYTYKAQFTNRNTGVVKRSDLSYDAGKRMLHFSIPDLDTNNAMQFDVMTFPKGKEIANEAQVDVKALGIDEGGNEDLDWFKNKKGGDAASEGSTANIKSKKAKRVVGKGKPKSLLDYNLRTSEFKTFKEKFNSFKANSYVTEIIGPDVHFLELEGDDYETFGKAELLGTTYTGNKKLVYAKAETKDDYFKKLIKPIVYDSYASNSSVSYNRDTSILGVVPVNDLPVSSWYKHQLENNNVTSFLKRRLPIKYTMTLRYKADYLYLRNAVVNQYEQSGDTDFYAKNKALIQSRFPVLALGKYSVLYQYITPGGIHKSALQQINYINEY